MKQQDRDFFQNPTTDPDYSVSGFWFWNDLITDEKTKEQLEMMHRIHADNPVVHARFGLQNEYLSEDWFKRIQHVLDTCKDTKQKIWLYDENNWPSGNCSWTITKEEKYREHYLHFHKEKLPAGECYRLENPDPNIINITAYSADGNAMDIKATVKNNRINYLAKENIEIYTISVETEPYEPIGKYSVDYLSKEVFKRFIESTHEKYKEQFSSAFGGIIKGIFMDEPRFANALPWTDTLQEEFLKRKGYDLIPYLPLLQHKNEQAAFFRYDYYDVISDLFAEATFSMIYDWCEDYGLKSTGHLLGEETIAAQSYFGADMVRSYKYLHVPAIDHLGNGLGSLNAKFAVSASLNYGKTRIACEAFGASGWDITFEDMVRISNWLFQQGINLIMMHGFYYSIREQRVNDFPPSYFYQWKYWDYMPVYVKMANRMMKILSDGQAETEILVYSPIETFWNYFQPALDVKTGFWENGPCINDDTAKFIDNQFQLLCNRLSDRNLDYNILGADAAKHFIVKNDKLINVLSNQCFSILILPCTEVLTDEMVQLIDTFTSQGGTVIQYHSNIRYIVNKDGQHMHGIKYSLPVTERFTEVLKLEDLIQVCRKQIKLPFEIRCGVDEMCRSHSSYPAKIIDPYVHNGERVYGVGVSRYLKDGCRIINITNYNEKEEEILLWAESRDIPEIFIPETGEITLPEKYVKDSEGYEFHLTLPKNRALFVICKLWND